MSDDIVFILPSDPTWQPTADAAQQTAAQACALTGIQTNVYPSVDVMFFDLITLAHPHQNLGQITCPRCVRAISVDWFHGLVDLQSPNANGFTDLTALNVAVPCCGERISLADLEYDWPAGFSRFRIALWNPRRDLTDGDLTALSSTLGHDVRLVRAHL